MFAQEMFEKIDLIFLPSLGKLFSFSIKISHAYNLAFLKRFFCFDYLQALQLTADTKKVTCLTCRGSFICSRVITKNVTQSRHMGLYGT